MVGRSARPYGSAALSSSAGDSPVRQLRAAGAKPLALAALLFGWLVCGGSAINSAIHWGFAD
jgi:uncharacterized membrane protein YadS